MNKKIVITRSQQQSEALALEIINHPCNLSMNDLLIEPITHVAHFPINTETMKAYDGIIITSSNAVTSLSLCAPNAEIINNVPFFCVGEQTKDNIKSLGDNVHIEICAPTVMDLVDRINEADTWGEKQFLYLRGRDIAYDMKSDVCNKDNINHIDEAICYDAKAAERFTPNYTEAVIAGKIGAVCFLSKRTAEIFVRLMEQEYKNGVLSPAHFGDVKALAISESARECLERVFEAENCIISKTPDMDGLIACIEEGLF